MKKVYVDLHAHGEMKPYGCSFDSDKPGNQSNNRSNKTSMWYYDPPTRRDKKRNKKLGLTKFKQMDFTSAARGNVGIICQALYPLERSFTLPQNTKKKVIRKLFGGFFNYVMEIGKRRIHFVQNMGDYFEDMVLSKSFIENGDVQDKIKKIDGNRTYSYQVAKNWQEIEDELTNPTTDHTTFLIYTIEGAHSFGSSTDPKTKKSDIKKILANIKKVKKWETPVLWAGMAHHFNNELCGHAGSLPKAVSTLLDQSDLCNEGILDDGLQVIDLLLDDTQGRRILIDLKHMSLKARYQYYALLENNYAAEKIPIIASHGGVTGISQRNSDGSVTLNKRILDTNPFNDGDINFDDEEIVKIGETSGLFGIQLDERRVIHPDNLKTLKDLSENPGNTESEKAYKWTKLIWNQAEYIAFVLDAKGLPAWDIQCIGSDFDGGINPIDYIWTAEDYPKLHNLLREHAFNFLQISKVALKQKVNRDVTSEELAWKIMGGNAQEFFKKWF